MTFASALVKPSPSAVRLGNIFEILSWHAYEHDRPEYIIGLLYITMTRAIANDAQAVDSRQSAGDHAICCATPTATAGTIAATGSRESAICMDKDVSIGWPVGYDIGVQTL